MGMHILGYPVAVVRGIPPRARQHAHNVSMMSRQQPDQTFCRAWETPGVGPRPHSNSTTGSSKKYTPQETMQKSSHSHVFTSICA